MARHDPDASGSLSRAEFLRLCVFLQAVVRAFQAGRGRGCGGGGWAMGGGGVVVAGARGRAKVYGKRAGRGRSKLGLGLPLQHVLGRSLGPPSACRLPTAPTHQLHADCRCRLRPAPPRLWPHTLPPSAPRPCPLAHPHPCRRRAPPGDLTLHDLPRPRPSPTSKGLLALLRCRPLHPLQAFDTARTGKVELSFGQLVYAASNLP